MLQPARIALAAAAASLLLTACAGAPSETATPTPTPTPSETATPTPTPTPTIPASSSLEAITVSGSWLKTPELEFEAPFRIDETRWEVVQGSDDRKIPEGGFVTVHYHGVNARTGEVFEESFTGETPATFSLEGVIRGFSQGLTGQAVGSRVLIAVAGPDGYDDAYAIDPAYAPTGYELGDTLLFVVDIVDASLTEPDGEAVTPPSGLPTVTAGTGRPTVTIPSTTAPTTMTAQVLIKGTGTAVTAEDTILARYVGVSWKTGEVVDDGFDTPTYGPLAGLLPGWISGLEGKQVGSRVLLVLPPEYGYPEGSNDPPVEAGDTVVYVVDLLFAYSQ